MRLGVSPVDVIFDVESRGTKLYYFQWDPLYTFIQIFLVVQSWSKKYTHSSFQYNK